MMLLNARLGYWVANPITKRPKMREPKRTQHWPVPNHLHPGLIYAISRSGYKYNSQYLELTDGGHFENLGLYELIRRRCQVILICDGEADKQTAYLAFVSAVRRIEEDFRATIEFIPNHGVERIVANQTMDYPADAKCSRFPYIVAKVNYADDSHGVILYLKAAITEEASFKVKDYKGANPDFPNETTADQFFDPVQFEAYRELGYRGAYAMIDGLGLNKTNIWDWEAIWEKAKSAST